MRYYVRTRTEWLKGTRPWEIYYTAFNLGEALRVAEDLLLRGYTVSIAPKEE